MLKKTIFILAGLILVGCGDDTDKTEDTDDTDVEMTEFELLTEYMAAEGLDLPEMLDTWIIAAPDVFDAGIENYFIIDIRTGDKNENGTVDFDEGHIDGAHMVALADVVDYAATNNTSNLPILVVCYTGQTAGHAVMSLRLHGQDAQVLKFGMSGWHSDFDSWSGNTGNAALDYSENWSTDAAPALGTFDLPELSTGETTGDAILAYQIDNAVLDGFNKVTNAEVLGAPEDYFVVNYWGEEDYLGYGHIAGAYQVTPRTDADNPGDLMLDTLDILDPSQPIVVYCWTGQTSSMVTAWLSVLGYDVTSLVFGANGMIYDELTGHKWSASADLAYVTE